MPPDSERKLPTLPPFERQRGGALKVCDVCGQHFDMRDQEHVFHHRPEAHEPLLPPP